MPSSISAVFIRPSDVVTVIISLMDRKASRNQFPSGISQANFLGHRQVISYPFRSPRDGGGAKSSKFQLILARLNYGSFYVLRDATAAG
jgi:hypothetical protein